MEDEWDSTSRVDHSELFLHRAIAFISDFIFLTLIEENSILNFNELVANGRAGDVQHGEYASRFTV